MLISFIIKKSIEKGKTVILFFLLRAMRLNLEEEQIPYIT